MNKRIIGIIMAVVVLMSSFSISAFAATSRSVYIPTGHSWSNDVKCTLSNKKKAATVRATMDNWGVNLDIRMRNGSKVIWSENNAIRYSSKATVAWVYRDFNLGCDHTYYNLSFRCNKSAWVSPSLTVKAIKNCSVS